MRLITDLQPEEVEQVLRGWGEPAYRARQLLHAVYRQLAPSFDEMTGLPQGLRARLAVEFALSGLSLEARRESGDGLTAKYLFRLHDGNSIESVLMRYPSRAGSRARTTACISTQVGCAVGCPFCATGASGFVRNLSTGEIVGQALTLAREAWDGGRRAARQHGLSNVVFMGMGEPLANYDATLGAVRLLTHRQGFGMGARRLTISTAGMAPQILRLASDASQVNLSISLHAADDRLRDRLVPLNRRYPLARLTDACRAHQAQTGRRPTFEYVLLERVNDGREHAEALARLLGGMDAHVNLIRAYPVAGCPYAPSSRPRALAFQRFLTELGVKNTMRAERGGDIEAGCGQLRAGVLSGGKTSRERGEAPGRAKS